MNKIFIAAALGLSVLSSAQIDFSSTRFGATVGGNYSRVRHAHNPSGPLYGFNIGAMALIPLGGENQFFIQPEVKYSAAGETGKDKDAKGFPGYDAKYGNNYISVPIYFKAYFSEAESEFFGMLGPKFNFLIGQNIKNPSKPYYVEEQLPEYPGVNGKASGLNFAVSGGVGYSYKREIEIGITYDLGLSNTYKNLMSEPGSDPNISKKKSEHVVSLNLTYIFK